MWCVNSHHIGAKIIMAGYIRYEIKNGKEYASVYRAKRIEGKKINEVEWLGRVIDKEKGIYHNRKKGTYQFTIESGIVAYLPSVQEKLILDYGDSFLLHKVLKETGFLDLCLRVFGDNADSVLAMVFYKSLQGGANCYAGTWLEGAYARMLFPAARIASQRVIDILQALGAESLQRAFFSAYLRHISAQCNGGILIDSTGLPNDIHFPLVAINNHNGVVSHESRLIFVLDAKSRMPIYFRYAAGNIVDVTTLKASVAELREYGIDITKAIIDAGYFSENNIKEMQKSGISFITRMKCNLKQYKTLVKENKSDLENAKHLVKYRERFVYIKRVKIDLYGKEGYAYIGCDIDRKHDEVKRYINNAFEKTEITFDEMDTAIQSKGLFILVSSNEVETNDILPLYYTRQAIEQVFDIGKNNADLLPLRVHGVDKFRGHLLLSFLTSAAYILVNNKLANSDFCTIGAYRLLRNLKCKVYDKKIIVQEANKLMNDIAKHLGFEYPTVVTG